MLMMIIIAVIVGLAIGYAIAVVYPKKQRLSLDISPQTPPVPQNVSYLDDKMWYEAELNLLFKFSEQLSITTDYKKVTQHIVEAAYNFLPVERSVLLMLDRDAQTLVLACAIGWERAPGPDFVIQGEENISGVVMRRRETLVVNNLQQDSYLKQLNKEGYLKKAFISAPLVFQNEILGVLHVCDKKSPGDFTPQEASVVTDIARLGAIALQNARLYEQMQHDYLQTISALATAVDARDAYTRFHSGNVTRYAVAIAVKMECRAYEIDIIKRAAILHDIGKIGIKDAVLLKSGRLTPEEFEHIKQHPAKGEEIVKILQFLKEEAILIRHHHERHDGSGYPDGVKGFDIELGARILAVADAFDAMTTDRPYRKALPVEEALLELERNKGTQFDPEIVTCLHELIRHDPSLVHPAEPEPR
jgi:HD-GYP domain-containing protein (c-di-GMP phosphodiesterase class II)/uncharacterized membrane-anchored protein YhcB (DUF1043 family)